MWWRGLAILNMIFLRKFEEIPLWSGVFLSCKSIVASKISVMVTGELFRLNTLLLYAMFSVADLLEGFICLTTLTAAVAKNLLNDSAIKEGSLMSVPSTLREEQFSFLPFGLRIALDKICQVLRRFLELLSIWEWRKFFLAVRTTRLYKLRKFL